MSWIADNPILFALAFVAVIALAATLMGKELPEVLDKDGRPKRRGGEGAIGDSDGGGDGGGD